MTVSSPKLAVEGRQFGLTGRSVLLRRTRE